MAGIKDHDLAGVLRRRDLAARSGSVRVDQHVQFVRRLTRQNSKISKRTHFASTGLAGRLGINAGAQAHQFAFLLKRLERARHLRSTAQPGKLCAQNHLPGTTPHRQAHSILNFHHAPSILPSINILQYIH
ncbi:MAG: hypothetical protein WCP99_21760 [Burkholderiales bacterium]